MSPRSAARSKAPTVPPVVERVALGEGGHGPTQGTRPTGPLIPCFRFPTAKATTGPAWAVERDHPERPTRLVHDVFSAGWPDARASNMVVMSAAENASSLRDLLVAHRHEIQAAVASHRGRRVRLFGSVARGDDTAASDIDLLVDFEPGSSLFDLQRLGRELETLLGQRVDVVSAGGLKARDRQILADAVDL